MTDNNDEGYVKSHHTHGITTIEFFHPKSNSMPSDLLAVLVQHLHRANVPSTKVIVIKSAGSGAFCAGASFDELINISNEAEGFHFFMGFANVINEMRKSEKLIIARIHGKCVGGGVGIAAAADYTIACELADVRLSELSIGIGPFVIGPAVQRKMGISAFSQLAIDAGMWRTAQWAKTKGLFAEVHPSVESMDESVERISNSLAKYSHEAMSEIKRVLWSSYTDWDELLMERARISGRLIMGPEAREAIAKARK